MKGVIPVGGVGSHLRPLAYALPKPMLPLDGRPLIESSLDFLVPYGFDEVVAYIAYLKKTSESYLTAKRDLSADLLRPILKRTEKDMTQCVDWIPMPKGPMERLIADVTKAWRLLGFRASTLLKEGLGRLL